MGRKLSRREFLERSGAAAATLTLVALSPRQAWPSAHGNDSHRSQADSKPVPRTGIYGDWRDVYTEKWSWDRIAHCTHTRVNCLSACAWNVFVKDGIVWREEQAQVYDEGRAGAPDFFPRGCQKGACYSDLMHSPQRLRYPLERVGPRGSGKWKRISWDEAIDKVARAIADAHSTHGPESIVFNPGPNFEQGPNSAGEFRLSRVLGSTLIDSFAGIGDMAVGAVQTWGMFMSSGTSDDWFNSDYVILWSANPVYTRIPDMHFLTEVRYRGARIVHIGPDYNATAIHADLWLNPRVESDPALALAMAQVIASEDRIDHEYVREQTDLPFLVRTDTHRFLRESDVAKNGRDDVFYFWDERQDQAVRAPGSQGMRKPTLSLGKLRPALEGRYRVRLANGEEVEVEPVYAALRRTLDTRYTPEQVAEIAGVGTELIRRVAREMAAAGSAMIYASVGACKHYHSDLLHRATALLMALTGNQGRPGGGLRFGSWWTVTGFDKLGQLAKVAWWEKLYLKVAGRPAVRDIEKFMIKQSAATGASPALPWLYVTARSWGRPSTTIPTIPSASTKHSRPRSSGAGFPSTQVPGKTPRCSSLDRPIRSAAGPPHRSPSSICGPSSTWSSTSTRRCRQPGF